MSANKILVAVAFTNDGLLTKPSQAAIDEAIYWAEAWGAAVRFAHFFEVPDSLWEQMRAKSESSHAEYFRTVRSALESLVAETAKRGLKTSSTLGRGRAWMELILEAQREGADLVFAGTVLEKALARAIFGGTTRKLLRNCPVPVWVAKAEPSALEGHVLAAHDLNQSGETVLRYATEVATRLAVPLKVVHALEIPELDRFLGSVSSETLSQEKEQARLKIEAQLQALNYRGDYQIVLELAPPATAIHHLLRKDQVRLLVMGSVGRSGVQGLIMGNTAETLLPWVDCSALVVKPEGFVSPVS